MMAVGTGPPHILKLVKFDVSGPAGINQWTALEPVVEMFTSTQI